MQDINEYKFLGYHERAAGRWPFLVVQKRIFNVAMATLRS